MRLSREQSALPIFSAITSVRNKFRSHQQIVEASRPVSESPIQCEVVQPDPQRRADRRVLPCMQWLGNRGAKQLIYQAEYKGKDGLCEAPRASPMDQAIPQVRVFLVFFHAIRNFKKPRQPDPGPKRVAKNVQDLNKELVFERQGQILEAACMLALREVQAILRSVHGEPYARLPDRIVQIHLPVPLQGIQIVF